MCRSLLKNWETQDKQEGNPSTQRHEIKIYIYEDGGITRFPLNNSEVSNRA